MNSEILQQTTQDDLLSLYPAIAEMDHQSRFILMNNSLVTTLPPQTLMQADGGPYQHLFLLLEGVTRAYQCDDNGRELTFYRNYPGDICPLNIQSLFNKSESNYLVRAETVVHGIQISGKVLQQCMTTSDVLRNFIMQHMSNSFNQLAMKLQESVFHKLDQRLCHLLSDMFSHSNETTLKITHQKLANELGTTREVISRSLKALENQGCLKITRGKLTMVSPEKLT